MSNKKGRVRTTGSYRDVWHDPNAKPTDFKTVRRIALGLKILFFLWVPLFLWYLPQAIREVF